MLEHILPVKAYVKLFDTCSAYEPNESYVNLVLYNILNAAVVTKEENDKYRDSMPNSFYETDNIFDRYNEVRIVLKRVVWGSGAKAIKDIKDIDPEENPYENVLIHVLQDMENSLVSNAMAGFDELNVAFE